MGWFGHKIYDGDETQTCHLDFCKGAKLYNGKGYDWMESHLSKIDHMIDSVNDAFEHDEYEKMNHMGDMGTGGCPPGHYWCTSCNTCKPDNKPQTEPLTFAILAQNLFELVGVLIEKMPFIFPLPFETCNLFIY